MEATNGLMSDILALPEAPIIVNKLNKILEEERLIRA